MFGSAVLPVFFLLGGGEYLFSVFGKQYTIHYPALGFLLAAQVVNALLGMPGSLLITTGKSRVILWITAVGLAANLVLTPFLVLELGVLGAAVGAFASFCVIKTALWVYCLVKLRFDTSVVGYRLS
ncbi:MAG: hypothetical protein HC848_06390 [Limnobacter sp.]|nr:hypothetical protein [Limnobacter sp.]